MKIFKPIGRAIASIIKAVWNFFDAENVLLFGGFPVLGYGLFLQYGLGISLIVCGGCSLSLGCAMAFMGGKK